MSDTPRTDEEIKHYGGLQRVSADFARNLERELAESNALLLQARTMLDDAAHGRMRSTLESVVGNSGGNDNG